VEAAGLSEDIDSDEDSPLFGGALKKEVGARDGRLKRCGEKNCIFQLKHIHQMCFFLGIFQLKPVKPDFWAVEKTISTRQKHMWLEQLQDIVRWTSLVFSGHGTAPGGGQFLLRHLGCEARVGAPQ